MAWWRAGHAYVVVFDPNVKTAGTGDLLLGLGDANSIQDGISLNQKGQQVVLPSVSAYVAQASDELVQEWRRKLPDGIAGLRRIVVEDLSLDTCFAVLLLACRLADKKLPGAAWVDYVSEWEKGNCIDADPARSIACLHTALAHSYFRFGADAAPAAALLRDGFAACLDFLSAALAASDDPLKGRLPETDPSCQRAMAHFRFEQQNYQLALQHGCVCQLLLPLESGRKMLVDALVVEEEQPSALLKIFARRDTSTYTGSGFTLLALFRPNLAMTGNDMVISVDPASGVTLAQLWRRLEDLENQQWEGARPSGHPRDLTSYRLPGGGLQPGAPDQPWYDDNGRYTLLAAPKAVDGQPGTRLSWRDHVLPALWSLYLPVPADDDLAVTVSQVGKFRKAEVKWKRRGQLSVSNSPTFRAWLASLSRGGAVGSPLELPRPNELEVLPVRGGVAIAHAEGATLFDDWTHQDMEIGLNQAFDDIAHARTTYGDFLEERVLDKALDHQKRAARKSFDPVELRRWKERLLEHKRELLAVGARTLGSGESANCAAFRDSLKSHWGLASSYAEAERTIDRIEVVTDHIYGELAERRDLWFRAIATGFATAFMAKEVAETIRPLLVPNWHEWTFELAKGHHSVEALRESLEHVHHYEIFELGVLGVIFAAAALVYRRLQISLAEK